jgi:hypothetical protein
VPEKEAHPEAQPDGISPAGIAAAGAVIMSGLAITLWAVWIMAGPSNMHGTARVLPPAEDSSWFSQAGPRGFPLLQADPAADLRAFRAREDSILDGYGWIDRDAGRVRVPIERAMEIWARRSGRDSGVAP